MAHKLDYEWDKDWADGSTWVADEGIEFPDGEADYFIIFLQEKANDLDLWAQTRISRHRYSPGVKVIFRFVEREDEP